MDDGAIGFVRTDVRRSLSLVGRKSFDCVIGCAHYWHIAVDAAATRHAEAWVAAFDARTLGAVGCIRANERERIGVYIRSRGDPEPSIGLISFERRVLHCKLWSLKLRRTLISPVYYDCVFASFSFLFFAIVIQIPELAWPKDILAIEAIRD